MPPPPQERAAPALAAPEIHLSAEQVTERTLRFLFGDPAGPRATGPIGAASRSTLRLVVVCDKVRNSLWSARKAEIKAVQKRLAELAKLENSKQILPLAEMTKLNARPKLLEDLSAMQAESRGWFWEAA